MEKKMQKKVNSFSYIENNKVKWIAGGIFNSIQDRRAA